MKQLEVEEQEYLYAQIYERMAAEKFDALEKYLKAYLSFRLKDETPEDKISVMGEFIRFLRSKALLPRSSIVILIKFLKKTKRLTPYLLDCADSIYGTSITIDNHNPAKLLNLLVTELTGPPATTELATHISSSGNSPISAAVGSTPIVETINTAEIATPGAVEPLAATNAEPLPAATPSPTLLQRILAFIYSAISFCCTLLCKISPYYYINKPAALESSNKTEINNSDCPVTDVSSTHEIAEHMPDDKTDEVNQYVNDPQHGSLENTVVADKPPIEVEVATSTLEEMQKDAASRRKPSRHRLLGMIPSPVYFSKKARAIYMLSNSRFSESRMTLDSFRKSKRQQP